MTNAARKTRPAAEAPAAEKPALETLAVEIAETLKGFGGGAHCKSVIDYLAALHRSRGEKVGGDFASLVTDAFERHCAQASGLFHRPFGPGSNRWALRQDSGPRTPLWERITGFSEAARA